VVYFVSRERLTIFHHTLRIGLFFAAAHFLLTVFLLAIQSDLVVVLLAPLALLVPLIGPSFSFSPLAVVLPIAFAGLVWALLLLGLYALIRRRVRYRPNPRLSRLGRRAALLVVAASLTYLFFGPLVGFAGDRIYGVPKPVTRLEGAYHVSPLWLTISGLCWAAGLFAAYRFLIVTPTSTAAYQSLKEAC
jgi:hypothetical protein